MARVRTYVMQVATGRELKTLDLMGRVLGEDAGAEFFVPRFQYHKKIKGAWQLVEELLTPGYLYARTSARSVDDLARRLWQVPAFTRMLAQDDGSFVPLSSDEEAWLVRLTGADHVVEPSIGFIEGDRVVITEGPLAGLESQIKKIDRHKRLAYIDVHLMGRTKTIKVGAEIVRKSGTASA